MNIKQSGQDAKVRLAHSGFTEMVYFSKLLKKAFKRSSLYRFQHMICFHPMVKSSERAIEVKIMAVDSVCAPLECIPNIRIAAVRHEQLLASDYQLDARIDFGHDDIRQALLIEAKLNGAPRFARSTIYQLESYIAHLHRSDHQGAAPQFIPILVSSYLSPDSRSICLGHNVAYLDLYGNAHLAFGNVYIERSVADRPKSEPRAPRSLFTPKAAAILRVLLRDPARVQRVTDLAEAANASLGHVSYVRNALLNREWIEVRDDGLVLVQPDTLLKSWRENYRQPAGSANQRIYRSTRG